MSLQKARELHTVYQRDGLKRAGREAGRFFTRRLSRVVDPVYQRVTPSVQTVTFDGDEIHLDRSRTSIDSTHPMNFGYVYRTEHHLISSFADDLSPGDVVYDIGGHVGLYTVIAGVKQQHNGADFHVFEPNPEIRAVLEHNCNLNGLSDVCIHPVALGDQTQECWIQGYKLYADRPSAAAHPTRIIPGQMLTDHAQPSVLKLDVDGSELDVLRGFGDALDNVRLIYCELHPTLLAARNQTADEVVDLLEGRGFRVDGLQTRGAERHIRAYTPST
jgi:FkbM family methyltransferase